MNLKKFEYQHKDIPLLKKDIFARFVFAILFLLVAMWQFATLILELAKGPVSIFMIVSTIFVLMMSIVMSLCGLMYAFKDFRIITNIKKDGKCVSTVQVLYNIDKAGFIRLYQAINFILSLLTTLIIIATATYSFLEIAYYSTISYYLPILFIFCLVGYNSVFHIKYEINTVKLVKTHHSIY